MFKKETKNLTATKPSSGFGLIVLKLLVLAIALAPSVPFAAIDRRVFIITEIDAEMEETSLDLKAIAKMEKLYNSFEETDYSQYIPSNLRRKDTQDEMAEKFLKHGVETFFKSSKWSESKIIKAAKKLDGKINTSVQFKNDNNKKGIDHKVDLNFQALTSEAQLKYQGLIGAQIDFNVETQHHKTQLSKQLSQSTQLVVVHHVRGEKVSDTINLRYQW